MKLYAVVIGRKDRHLRYVAYAPKIGNHRNGLLAVYECRSDARVVAKEMKKESENKDIFVIQFIAKPRKENER